MKKYINTKLLILGALTLIGGQIQIAYGTPIFSGIITGFVIISALFMDLVLKNKEGLKIFLTGALCSFGVDAFLNELGISGAYYSHVGFVSIKIFGASLIYWVGIIFIAANFSQYKIKLIVGNFFLKWYIIFGIYCIIVGIINVFVGGNYKFNQLLKDAFFYIAPIFFVYIILFQDEKDIIEVLVAIFCVILMGVITANYMNANMYYGGLNFSVLPNAYNFAVIMPLLTGAGMFSGLSYIFLWIVFYVGGYVYAGVKTYAGIFLTIVYIVRNKNKNLMWIVLAVFLFMYGVLVSYIENNSMNDAAAYKLTQLTNSVNPIFIYNYIVDGEIFGGNQEVGSLFNIMSEGYVLFKQRNFIEIIFGSGFGSFLYDNSGLLGLAGESGYSELMLKEDLYTDFHLPIYRVFHWGGFIGVFLYLMLLKEVSSIKKSGPLCLIVFMFVMFTTFVDQIILEAICMFFVAYNWKLNYDNFKVI